MFLRCIFFCCCFATVLCAGFLPEALAQHRPDVHQWAGASVYLATGDTLTGELTYYRQEDIIRVQQAEGGSATLSPVNVAGFVVKDKATSAYREFKTYLWNRNNDRSGFKSPAFFEHLTLGKYSLLKRETVVRVNAGHRYGYNPYGPPMPMQDWYEIKDLFYLLTPDHQVITLRNPKKDLPPLFGSFEKQMKAFVREHNLNYNNTRDLATIIRYYNSLL